METLAWAVLIICCLIGLLGVFLPIVPGAVLILAGAVVHKLMLPEILSWWTIVILVVGTGLSYAADIFGTIAGAKWGGAGRWGLAGAGVGVVVGLFFGLVGIVFGPLLGAFIGELVFAGREIRQAARAGVGAAFGLAISMLLHLVIAVVMIGALVIDGLVGKPASDPPAPRERFAAVFPEGDASSSQSAPGSLSPRGRGLG